MLNEFWTGKSVLVTGAGGFIASHLVDSLISKGARVRVFVRYNSRGDTGLLSKSINQENIEIIAGDLRDHDAVDKSVAGIDIVFHLGALVSIPYSYYHPVEVVETNVNGSLNVLMACRKHSISRLIHASSSEVYGTAIQIPIDEGHSLQGQSPYSASKIAADKLVESFYCAYNLPATIVRPFNTYGPRQSARAVIPTIISQALTGNVIKLGNINTRRDFTFIDDTVRGFLLAASTDGIDGRVIHLGTGTDVAIRDIVELVIKLTGHSVQVEVDEQRFRPDKSEVLQLVSDNSLARKLINWSPEITLENGLRKTIQWIEENINMFDTSRYVF